MSTVSHRGQDNRWDLAFLVSVLVILIGSIVPLSALRQNLWNTPGVFFLGVGVLVPLVAASLVLARTAGGGRPGPRVGSLSTAQFAHVASWLALAFFFTSVVTTLNPVFLIGLLGALGMVATSPLRALVARALEASVSRRSRPAGAGTTPAASPEGDAHPEVAARPEAVAHSETAADSEPAHHPETGPEPQGGDLPEAVAHREVAAHPEAAAPPETGAAGPIATPADEPDAGVSAAREAGAAETAPSSSPEADTEPASDRARPAEEAQASTTAAFGAGDTDAPEVEIETEAAREEEPTGRQAEAAEQAEPAGYEAFWFAVGSPRMTVHPEDGSPAFSLEPGGWILALEDRGDEFLVQDTDGRTGVLRDLSAIERA